MDRRKRWAKHLPGRIKCSTTIFCGRIIRRNHCEKSADGRAFAAARWFDTTVIDAALILLLSTRYRKEFLRGLVRVRQKRCGRRGKRSSRTTLAAAKQYGKHDRTITVYGLVIGWV